MQTILWTIGVGALGIGCAIFFRSAKYRKQHKDFINEKRKNFDMRLKLNSTHIDSVPIEELLKDGEYLKK